MEIYDDIITPSSPSPIKFSKFISNTIAEQEMLQNDIATMVKRIIHLSRKQERAYEKQIKKLKMKVEAAEGKAAEVVVMKD